MLVDREDESCRVGDALFSPGVGHVSPV